MRTALFGPMGASRMSTTGKTKGGWLRVRYVADLRAEAGKSSGKVSSSLQSCLSELLRVFEMVLDK